jgi:Domain of unknown function (DUF4413)
VLLLLLNYLLFHVFFIGGASPAVWEFDPARCRKSFARMVITHKYPINCAKHHFLKVFISDLQPYFKMVLRNTLRLDCVKIYEERRVSLYELFGKLYYSSAYPFIVKIRTKIFIKCDKYWTSENILLTIACVPDSRCKLVVIEYYIEKMYADNECSRFIVNLKSCMNELFKEYSEAHSRLIQNQASSSTQPLRRYS